MNEAILAHSHVAHRLEIDRVMREVGVVLRRLVAHGIHPGTVHQAALAELAGFRVERMNPEDLAAEFRHPTARMGSAELSETIERRVAEGWPADGKPLA